MPKRRLVGVIPKGQTLYLSNNATLISAVIAQSRKRDDLPGVVVLKRVKC
jgi:hypothetical protein